MKSIYFTALGGAQSVGSSCYYLRLGESNVLLDCGVTKKDGLVFGPNLQPLVKGPFMQSFSELDHVYISHAHSDHVGYLNDLLQLAPNTAVYMTPLTRVLSEQRMDIDNFELGNCSLKQMSIENNMKQCIDVSFMQQIKQHQYRVAFFEAGHIPGVMMTLIEYEGRRILYTGDYSVDTALGLSGCRLPENLNVDVLIMCALHAKHPYQRRQPNLRLHRAMEHLRWGQSIYLQVKEPSKVLEQLVNINTMMAEAGEYYPIYLEASAMETIRLVEQLDTPILQRNNFIMPDYVPDGVHVVIGSATKGNIRGCYKLIDSTYTLHEDYNEMKSFIKRINPRQALLVHCAEGFGQGTIEQELMLDPDCRTQIIFPQEGQIYTI